MTSTPPAPATFDDLVASATVGLGVRPLNLSRLPAAVSPSGPGDAEAALLDAAALFTVARRASRGLCPDRWEIPAPPEIPPVSDWRPAALGALRQLLAEKPEVAAAALGIVTRRGAELPVALVPELAQKALTPGSPLRRAVAGAVGPLGRWLLEQNPAWQTLLGSGGSAVLQNAVNVQSPPKDTQKTAAGAAAANEDDWLHGDLDARVSYLTTLRGVDPAAGREALDEQWKKSKVKEKAALLGALSTGLSAADAEFLDRVRADRSDQVAEAALGLLCRLEQGPFAERRAGLIASHFTAKRGLFRKTVEVADFEADPKEGIPVGAADSVAGFIRYTPLPLWGRVLGTDLAELLTWAWTGIPVDAARAFFFAAVAQDDTALQITLLPQIKEKPWTLVDGAASIARLPWAVRVQVARQALAKAEGGGLGIAVDWLGSPLPPEVTPDAVAALQRVPTQLSYGPVIALAYASSDQLAPLRRLADKLPDSQRSAALRQLGHLTLLTRLDQELS
ncbi:MAG: DUF5691 domain-containing protein [Propionibacteriaceae bacterium]|jgi:hypothetical protein|nr:DUF5691 domain-containing protein [Propionibacteriaceae bacterium]